jgi:hypothetical protein
MMMVIDQCDGKLSAGSYAMMGDGVVVVRQADGKVAQSVVLSLDDLSAIVAALQARE